MFFSVKEDVSLGPAHVRLLRSQGVMARTYGDPDAIEQSRWVRHPPEAPSDGETSQCGLRGVEKGGRPAGRRRSTKRRFTKRPSQSGLHKKRRAVAGSPFITTLL